MKSGGKHQDFDLTNFRAPLNLHGKNWSTLPPMGVTKIAAPPTLDFNPLPYYC